MNIKTWKERLDEKADGQIITTATLNCAMMDEIDELRAALASAESLQIATYTQVVVLDGKLEDRDAEIEGWKADQKENLANQCNLQATINAQRRVLERIKSQQPVAWLRHDRFKAMTNDEKMSWIESGNADISEDYTIPVYLAAGAQERKPLKASEIVTMYAEQPMCDADMIEFAREVEAAHGIGEQP